MSTPPPESRLISVVLRRPIESTGLPGFNTQTKHSLGMLACKTTPSGIEFAPVRTCPKSAIMVLLSILLASYSAAAPVCDLSCSFMQLQSRCQGTSGTAESNTSASDMDMSSNVDMDMSATAMGEAMKHSNPAHPSKSPSSCVHASCIQASASRRTSTANQVRANLLGVSLLHHSLYNGIVFSQTSATATASPPLVAATRYRTSPLRI